MLRYATRHNERAWKEITRRDSIFFLRASEKKQERTAFQPFVTRRIQFFKKWTEEGKGKRKIGNDSKRC